MASDPTLSRTLKRAVEIVRTSHLQGLKLHG